MLEAKVFEQADVRATITSMSVARTVGLSRQFRKAGADVTGYTAGEALLLWLAEYWHRKKFRYDRTDLILDQFREQIRKIGDELWLPLAELEQKGWPSDKAKFPSAILWVWDERYASISGEQCFLDLELAKPVMKLPAAPLQMTGLDLTALFMRCRASMLKPKRQEGPFNDHDGG